MLLRAIQKEVLENSGLKNSADGGELPSDARMWGLSLGKMVESSIKDGVAPKDIISFLYNAGIKGKMATAIKAQAENNWSAKVYEEHLLGSAIKQIDDESAKISKDKYNEQIGAILDGAKARAIENDKLLKTGVGNTSLDTTTTIFKAGKNRPKGNDIEVE